MTRSVRPGYRQRRTPHYWQREGAAICGQLSSRSGQIERRWSGGGLTVAFMIVTRRQFAFMGAAGVAALLAACGRDSGVEDIGTQQVSSDVGTTEIPIDPQRIVAIDFYSPSALIDLGITPAAVASTFDDAPDVPEPYRSVLQGLPKVGDYLEPSAEKILAAAPDLIVTVSETQENDPEFFAKLQATAPTIGFASHDWDAWKVRSRGLGQILGRADKVSALEDEYNSRIETFRTSNADVLENTTVAFVFFDAANSRFGYYPSTIWQTAILGEAGFQFTERSKNLGGKVEWLPKEQLEVMSDVDVIFTTVQESGNIAELLKGDTLFERLPAVQNGLVFIQKNEAVSSFGWALTYLDQLQPFADKIRAAKLTPR